MSAGPDSLTVLVASDQGLFLEGLCEVLRTLEPGVAPIRADSFAAAQEALVAGPPVSLALLDLALSDLRGVEGAAELSRRRPQLRVAVLAEAADGAEARAAFRGGLQGYIPKSLSGGAAVAALRLIACGGAFFPPDLLLQPERRAGGLDDQEQRVVAELRLGRTNKAIAQRLGLDVTTVKRLVRSAGAKLGGRTRTEIALRSLELERRGASRPAVVEGGERRAALPPPPPPANEFSDLAARRERGRLGAFD